MENDTEFKHAARDVIRIWMKLLCATKIYLLNMFRFILGKLYDYTGNVFK